MRPGVRPPPSLQNIFKELESDLGISPPAHGGLDSWARQGVLLLNASLTVRAGKAASHQGKGWETFTDAVLHAVNTKQERVVFILWGASARKKKALIDTGPTSWIESPIPSPCRRRAGSSAAAAFSRANAALVEAGREPIDWALPPGPTTGRPVGPPPALGLPWVDRKCSAAAGGASAGTRPAGEASADGRTG